jgi:hypothetical protein
MRQFILISVALLICLGAAIANRCPPPCQHQDPGDRCLEPMTMSGICWEATFDLCDYCNDYDLSPCTGYSSDASDMVFIVTFNSGENDNDLDIIVDPDGCWDISLAVISECGNFGTGCLDGEDDNGAGWPESSTLSGLPDGTYFIVVSGYMSQCGVFDISVCSNHELPVELVSFEGIPGNRSARLVWRTASETDNSHFYLLRSVDSRNFERVSGDIPGTNSPQGGTYGYTDQNLSNGSVYYYKLVDVDINGVENVNDIMVEVIPTSTSQAVPSDYALHQNFPNPFNPTTSISYDVKEAGLVTLTIFDILGRETATLINAEQQVGSYSVEFDGSGLPSGIYFYQIKVNNFADMKKMILMK